MKYIVGSTFASVYHDVLETVCCGYDNIISPRGYEIKERCDVVIELTNPCNNLFLNQVRNLPLKYLCGELFWCFTGSHKLEDIVKFSKFWNKIANTDGTINSAYGWILFERNRPHITEWEWAYESLYKDKDSRQAIMHFNAPIDMKRGTKDFPCTISGTFQIRKDMLNFSVLMRSQDVIKGLTFDLPFFTMLQQNMYINLKRIYPTLKLGKFTLTAQSEHIYKQDYMLGYQMLNNPFYHAMMPLMQYPLVDVDMNYAFKNLPIYDSLINFILKGMEEKENGSS